MQRAEDTELVPLKTTFDIVWRGFDRDQVMRHLASIEEDVRMLTADRDASASQVDDLTGRLEAARSEIDELTKKIDALHKAPMNAAELGERLNRMLELANAEAAEITARAQAAAEHTWSSAEEAATNLRTRYQRMLTELDNQREEMAREHRETMEKANAEAKKKTTDAERRMRQMDEAAEKRRNKIEQEFEAAMTRRRADLDQEIAERQAASKAEADKRLREATAEAERRVRVATEEAERRTAEANRRVSELLALRAKVSEQLGATLNLFQDVTSLLRPVSGEERLHDADTTVALTPVSQPDAAAGKSQEATTAQLKPVQAGAAAGKQTAKLPPVVDKRTQPQPGKQQDRDRGAKPARSRR